MDESRAAFFQQLLGSQVTLRAFIRSLGIDRQSADDLLQQVNLVLCRKAEDFTPGTSFSAWSCRVAYFEVLSHRQKMAREREKLVFNVEDISAVAAEVEKLPGTAEEERHRLRACLAKLSPKQRELVRRRYEGGLMLGEIAAAVGRPVGSIRQTLFRIRLALLACLRGPWFGSTE